MGRVPKASSYIGPGAVDVAFEVNGDGVSVHVPPHRTLLDTLRETLGLTGAKRVCDEGMCGACTVLLDGEPVYSCMTLAVACAGHSVETVEGLSKDTKLHPIQEAFIEHDAFQCGFCTPGQIMSCVALLKRNAAPTGEDVLRAVSGNLCRCGAYPNIVAAALSAAKKQARR
jgi:Aerobic-type carbon monoxide dehydrogenase, small subunit CoxS/CutS homologs